MKCKRCGSEMATLSGWIFDVGCASCTRSEMAERAALGKRARKMSTNELLRVDRKISQKYKDAHKAS